MLGNIIPFHLSSLCIHMYILIFARIKNHVQNLFAFFYTSHNDTTSKRASERYVCNASDADAAAAGYSCRCTISNASAYMDMNAIFDMFETFTLMYMILCFYFYPFFIYFQSSICLMFTSVRINVHAYTFCHKIIYWIF